MQPQPRSSDVEALAHFLAGLEIGDALCVDVHGVAGAGIAALASVPIAVEKAPKPRSSTRPPC
jgi:hypothetical protein